MSLLLESCQASANCASASYLSQCSGTNTGTQCYYKYYMSATNTCTVKTKTIDKCISYWYQNDGQIYTAEPEAQCYACESGYYASIDLTESSWNKRFRCKTGDNAVNHCAFPGTYVLADGTVIRYCAGCNEGYVGRDYNPFVGAATSCTQNTNKLNNITNCQYEGLKAFAWNSSYSGTSYAYCMACKSGYVAAWDQLTCIANTDDKCARLSTDGTTCQQCWWPYWFQGSTCAKSNIINTL